ncbi:hypothetical protein C0Q70_03977 [Pomacea canaliculata]|uniref:Centrosomal protein of 104 kDa n=1 Tax=Pomacea canaliculata TaxID=400727 RepID=A0A2T7PU78_POMCA|nr:hypothetical protein C0Q70_03977 [Pomacea canaliculata]
MVSWTRMPHKLQFRVVHASGEDDVHKAGDLNYHGPLAQGWQSSRFCLYPQDIVVQLEEISRIRKIQILSHQYLIPILLKRHLQVGIVAINVIGDEVRKPGDINDPDLFIDVNDNRAVDRDPILDGLFNKPDYISPLDDLAFDMYQDPEIAQIIRKLERKKQEAVLQERYDYAKRLKLAIAELQKVGEKLGKMEVEKRQAVENEDYDKAKVKKLQMDEYRLQIYKDLNINDLLETTGTRHSMKIDFGPESYRQPTPPRLIEKEYSPPPPVLHSPTPRVAYDERPLPAAKNKPPAPQPEPSQPSASPKTHSERNLPVQRPIVAEEELEPDINQGEPEPMTEVDLREASSAIDVFGLPLVSKAYSKTWSYREDALLAVYKQMQELSSSSNKEDAKTMMRAAIFLVKKGVDDNVYAVFKAALSLLKMLLTEFVPKHKIPKQDTSSAVERSLQNLLHKTGDTAARNRDDAKLFVMDMARFPEVKPTQTVPHECVKPFKLNMAPRQAQSRAEIVEMLYKDFRLKDGLTLDNIMGFCTVALQHTAGEVREVSERIIKQLYRDVGAPVKSYLPVDDEKTRKNTLWRMLFEYFDKVDGKPSKADIKKHKAEEEAKKQAEIEALQKQLNELKQLTAAKEGGKDGPKPQKKKPEAKKNVLPPKTKKDDDEASTFNTDRICIFCGERNEAFTEEGLDIHYWKSCPMLKRCANCKQVVEIATYTEHVLTECEAKSNFGKCPRSAKPNMNHCPLCHENLLQGEEGWKEHLMGHDGCKQNPRRLLAVNKQPGTLFKGHQLCAFNCGRQNL